MKKHCMKLPVMHFWFVEHLCATESARECIHTSYGMRSWDLAHDEEDINHGKHCLNKNKFITSKGAEDAEKIASVLFYLCSNWAISVVCVNELELSILVVGVSDDY